jgi:hypothetical protein
MIKKITYRGKQYPYRVSYFALKHFSIDTGREYAPSGASSAQDLQDLEILLYHAIRGECKVQGVEFDIEKDEMEFVLDEGFMDIMESIQAFSQAVEKAAAPPRKAR